MVGFAVHDGGARPGFVAGGDSSARQVWWFAEMPTFVPACECACRGRGVQGESTRGPVTSRWVGGAPGRRSEGSLILMENARRGA